MFRSTFVAGMSGSIRSSQRENFKQLKHLVEKTIQESDENFEKIQERFHKLQGQDYSSQVNAENERPPPLPRGLEQMKASFTENDRIIAKMVKVQSKPILFNDSIFKMLLTDASKFYQKAMPHLDQVVALCCES